jgi:polar amino acid transport system substrate-binding protein
LRRWAVALLWLAILMAGPAAHAERVTVYTSATVGPLVINGTTGLYPELVAYLNQLKPGGLEFTLVTLPRKRLQIELNRGTLDGIVIGLMPQWVGDPAQTRFLWTDAFAHDGFVLVSRSANPFVFGQPATAGARIGVTLGYVYPGVDEWIERNKFVRDNAPSEEHNLDKLVLGRVDMAVVTDSVYRYYLRTHHATGGVIGEALQGRATERRFLLPKSKRELYDKLAPAIHKLRDDPHWRSIQDRY